MSNLTDAGLINRINIRRIDEGSDSDVSKEINRAPGTEKTNCFLPEKQNPELPRDKH